MKIRREVPPPVTAHEFGCTCDQTGVRSIKGVLRCARCGTALRTFTTTYAHVVQAQL